MASSIEAERLSRWEKLTKLCPDLHLPGYIAEDEHQDERTRKVAVITHVPKLIPTKNSIINENNRIDNSVVFITSSIIRQINTMSNNVVIERSFSMMIDGHTEDQTAFHMSIRTNEEITKADYPYLISHREGIPEAKKFRSFISYQNISEFANTYSAGATSAFRALLAAVQGIKPLANLILSYLSQSSVLPMAIKYQNERPI